MTTWYTAHYGSYKKGETVHRISGTFNRKEMFETARKIADATGKTVTIIAEKGMSLKCYDIDPT